MSTVSDKELKVLDQIARNSSVSQRELAQTTGISLGLINVILKKLLKTGHLQVSRLNRRSLEYLLTPTGFLAVSRRTYTYAAQTIRNYRRIHGRLSQLLEELNDHGYVYFSIHGEGELKELVTSLAKEILKNSSAFIGENHREDGDAAVLSVAADPRIPNFSGKVINILDSLELEQGQA